MRDNEISLKEFLDELLEYCNGLSRKELVNIIVHLARTTPPEHRGYFLESARSAASGGITGSSTDLFPVEDVLEDVRELKEDISERIESIEDGSIWEEYHRGYLDEDSFFDDGLPVYIDKDQEERLEYLFDIAGMFFLEDRLDDARKIYRALFDVVDLINRYSEFFPDKLDLKLARARYCRCVYETTKSAERLYEFAKAMEIDAADENDWYYPSMRDVINARDREMQGLTSFWKNWQKHLADGEKTARRVRLLVEATYHVDGIDGVSKLARRWKERYPDGYLFWLDILKRKNEPEKVIAVSKEALDAFEEGVASEEVVRYLLDAAHKLGSSEHILFAQRMKFFTTMRSDCLLDLVKEATVRGKRDIEIERAKEFCFEHMDTREDLVVLYTKLALMEGNLDEAFNMARCSECIGWSYRNAAGVVFGAILSAITSHSGDAHAVDSLFRECADNIYSYAFETNKRRDGTSFYEQIMYGLTRKKDIRLQAMEYFPWAEKIGRERVDTIVSNKYRDSYSSAALTLCSLAESYIAMGNKDRAEELLRSYYSVKYRRFRAFKREVKAVVMDSPMLRHIDLDQ